MQPNTNVQQQLRDLYFRRQQVNVAIESLEQLQHIRERRSREIDVRTTKALRAA